MLIKKKKKNQLTQITEEKVEEEKHAAHAEDKYGDEHGSNAK